MDKKNYSETWLDNAERQGVPAEVIAEISRVHDITPKSFEILQKMQEIRDPDGKSFFLIPPGAAADDARTAVLMTYVLNAGTGYGKAGKQPADFPETPYCALEIQRIIDRQNANHWSYGQDVAFADRNGARLVTTPNGILMGLGGNWVQQRFCRQGGTAWGDIFMVNVDAADPIGQLRQIVESGHAWYTDDYGKALESQLDLDRVLHHEELHCQQWADRGYLGMIAGYIWETLRERVFGKSNRIEEDAGLADGGYG